MSILQRKAAQALLLLALSTSGCVSYSRGKEMDAEIAALQGQVEQLSESQRQQSAKMRTELEGKLTAIQESISQLQRGSADGGLELERLREELRRIQGLLEETKQKLAAAQAPPENGVAVVVPPNAPPLPTVEAELYRYGYDRHKASDWDEAVRALNDYAIKFPGAAQADNALYLMAEALSKKLDLPASVRVLQNILQKYPAGDKVDDAYMLMHDNFLGMSRCKDASPFLESLIADQPQSNRVAEAKKKLAATKKSCK